ncbi:MAG: helix-turn-helix domain-containing protein [Egibacteraceae bacterium]
MDQDLSIGDRIRSYRRRRGMSQKVLGQLVGRSESWVSQVERGNLPVDRLSVIVIVARALKVEPGQLFGQPFLVRDGEELGEGVPGIRRALTGRDALSAVLGGAAGEVEPPDLDRLHRDVAQCWAMRQAGRYAALTGMLPDLIVRAEAATRAAVGDPRSAWRQASSVCQMATELMSRAGESDLAWIAAERALRVAERSEDRLIMAAAAWRLAFAFCILGRFDEGTDVAVIGADALGHGGSSAPPEHVSVWGSLHLIAMVNQSHEGDVAATGQFLAVAREAADRVGADRNDLWRPFGPTTVGVYETFMHVNLCHPGEALRAAERVDTSRLAPGLRALRTTYLCKVAQAYWQRRDDGSAVNVLLEAERVAPEELRYSAVVREMLVDFLRRERKGATPGLRPLAQRVGVLD